MFADPYGFIPQSPAAWIMSPTSPALHSAHMSLPAFSVRPDDWQNHVLGVISFSAASQPTWAAARLPCARVPSFMLQGADAACEVWLGAGPVAYGEHGDVRYRHDDATLFGVIEIAEPAQADAGCSPLQQVAEAAYRQIFALLDKLGYPCMYRFWNYMAQINAVSHGLERYRQFNIGRQNAFLACNREVSGQLPAACALGVAQGPLIVAFLAGRAPSRAIENPRQTSAYRYPRQYGPRSPTFSRANLLQLPDAEILLISGTASIVGHETRHHADAVAQTRESIANIEAVIDEANRMLGRPAFDLTRVYYRVYVRHVEDLPQVEQELLGIGPAMQMVFVQADICRAELLVEIEATAIAGQNAAARAGQ